MKKLQFIALALFTATLFSSCSDDGHDHGTNEGELITTVITTLTSGNQTITLTSKDLDGNGPNAPVVTTSGDLTVNTNYTGSIQFLNESVSPSHFN
jgi:ABC-type proline/glycine betaine transport system substrate-binding protein